MTPAFQRDSGASSQANAPQRGTEARAAQHNTPSAADAQLLSALRVCSEAGALGHVQHVREVAPHAGGGGPPAVASFGSEQSRGPQQPQLQGRPYSWEAGQQQGQVKKPRLAGRDDQLNPAKFSGPSPRANEYDSPEAWTRAPAPASIGE
jgi:hypothetical protein